MEKRPDGSGDFRDPSGAVWLGHSRLEPVAGAAGQFTRTLAIERASGPPPCSFDCGGGFSTPEPVSQFKQQYDHLWTRLTGDQEAHRKAVGGDFETVGYLEFQLLRMLGLRKESFVIDVGCGSGRLAAQLAPWLRGPYLGTDIMGSLLDYARALCGRPDWSFLETDGFEVPAPDACADFIVFFSVFTHLSHEDTWKYIQEAHRVLKPGGKLVCSFLEFAVFSHWTIFINTANDPAPDKILNQFLSRDALAAFAVHAGFAVESFLAGDQANIPIDRELTWQNGARMTGSGSLGQSTCVLVKR